MNSSKSRRLIYRHLRDSSKHSLYHKIRENKYPLALADQMVFSGTNFLTTVLVGRFCGAEQLGLYALVFAILVFVFICHESLIWTPLMIFSYRYDKNDRKRYLMSVLEIQVIVSGAGFFVILLLSCFFLIYPFISGLSDLMFVMAFVMPFYLLRDLSRRILFVERKMFRVFFLDCLTAIIHVLLMVYLLLNGQFSAITALSSLGFACFITLLCTGRFIFPALFFSRCLTKSFLQHWSFGKWILAGQILDTTRDYGLHWVIAYHLGTATTGVYNAYWSIVLIINPLIFGIRNVLLPEVSEIHTRAGASVKFRSIISKTTIYLGLFMAFISVFLIFYGANLIHLIFSHADYSGHDALIVLFAITALIMTIGFASNQGLLAMEQSRLTVYNKIAGITVLFTLVWIFMNSYGVTGAATARLLSTAIITFLNILVFYVLVRFPPVK